MPEDVADVDVVRRAFVASNIGDLDTFLAMLAPDVEWQSAGLFLHPAGTYHGPGAVVQALTAASEGREGLPHVTLRGLDATAGAVLVAATVSAPSNRRRVTLPIALVIDVREGLIKRVRTFRAEGHARAEFRRITAG